MAVARDGLDDVREGRDTIDEFSQSMKHGLEMAVSQARPDTPNAPRRPLGHGAVVRQTGLVKM